MSFLTERRRLGRPSKDVLENQRRIEREREEIRRLFRQEVIMCGIYPKGTEIKAQIVYFRSIDDFCIKNIDPTFKTEEKRLMKTAASIKYKSGALMYESRAYTTQPGQIKLFFGRFDTMHRCKIRDLFTVNFNGVLNAHASILLIDTGAYIRSVPLSIIFDIPQRIGHYRELEPEAKPARVHLGDPIPLDFTDTEICQYAGQKITNNSTKEFTIKILDYKKDVYHVDIIDQKKKSLVSHLRTKFKDKFVGFEKAAKDPNNQYHFFDVPVPRNRSYHSQNQSRYPPKKYDSIISYYKEKYKTINDNDRSTSYYQKRFLEVKIIHWDNPNSFAIIPNDDDYTTNHSNFMKSLENIQERKDKELKVEDELYVLGQKCLFLNDFDANLSKWLRGVVVDTPCKIDLAKDLAQLYLDGSNGSSSAKPKNLMYLIRSVDYGHETLRSSMYMRPVAQQHPSLLKGPWSLKCRLFGIYPLGHDVNRAGEHEFSTSCKSMIDSWIRERILDDGKHAYFNVLFKGDIFKMTENWNNSEDGVMDIVLFHRFDFPYRLEDCLLTKRRKPRYDCLNSFLIDRGLAGDCNNKTRERSYVDMDEYIVNLLVQHELL